MYTSMRNSDTGAALDNIIRRDSDGALIPADPDNRDWQAYLAWEAAGGVASDAPPLPPVVPDAPTLSDWRVGLALWGRLDAVTARVAALLASDDPGETRMGMIARERLEYANHVYRVELMQLADALGFGPADVDESLHRAERVRQGDLSGAWPTV